MDTSLILDETARETSEMTQEIALRQRVFHRRHQQLFGNNSLHLV